MFSPAQPRRAETRLSPCKAAADGDTAGVPFSPAQPELRSISFPKGYVEDVAEVRTPLGTVFTILLNG
jgi:hypothetical protein